MGPAVSLRKDTGVPRRPECSARPWDRERVRSGERRLLPVAEGVPGRPAGRLDQLDEDAVTAPRVDEGHGTFGPPPWYGVDQLHPIAREARQRVRQARQLEADVVESLPSRGQEARDAGRIVRRLDELELARSHRQEGGPDAIRFDR